VVVVDKLPILKQLIIDNFAIFIRQAQKGHKTSNGYSTIREAMFAINMLNNFTVDTNKQTAIIDYYLRRLNEI